MLNDSHVKRKVANKDIIKANIGMKKDRKRRRSRSRSKERKRGVGGTEEKLQKMQNQLNNLTNVLSQLVKSQQEMANTNTDVTGKKVLTPYEFALLIKEYRRYIYI